MSISLGIDQVIADHSLIPGSRWGLITNYTGVTSDLRLSSVALKDSPLSALLTPEHGLRGTVQAGESEEGGVDPLTGLPVLDTYRLYDADLDQAIADLDVDVLIVDIQDIGARFYTYSWTMVDCMRSAARLGIPYVILDRPNPLGGTASGPGVEPGLESFIGRIDVPIRHGLTIGELGRVAASLDRAHGIDTPDPVVIPLQGWTRDMLWADTGLTWVMPSPNIPTPDSAFAFVGTALCEGTNVSEGRGTTRPFELIGAPWLDEKYADILNNRLIPGAQFRSTWFSPTFNKWHGETLGGAQVYLDRNADPLLVGLHMVHAALDERFEWREPHWENGTQRPHFSDLMWGSSDFRLGIDTEFDALVSRLDATALRHRDLEWLLYS